jgi:membrane associated rhomboid family serine protease
MLGGIHLTDVVKNLLLINILMFFGTELLIPDSRAILGLFYPQSELFRPYQIVTHLFMHGNFTHILFNMFALIIFGPALEALWGPKKFLTYYFITGFGAMLLHMIAQYLEIQYLGGSVNSMSWGASGAIYGILMAFGLNFPHRTLRLIIPPIPVKAIYLVLILISMDVFLGFGRYSTGVAHFAHLGGELIGFWVMEYWKKNP